MLEEDDDSVAIRREVRIRDRRTLPLKAQLGIAVRWALLRKKVGSGPRLQTVKKKVDLTVHFASKQLQTAISKNKTFYIFFKV